MANLEDPDLAIPLLIPQPVDRPQSGFPFFRSFFLRSGFIQGRVKIDEMVRV